MAGLMLLKTVPWVTSEAVTVAAPAVLSVTPLVNVNVPATRAALAGSTAFVSVELIATVSLVPITFQLASTALTVTLKAVPAISFVGVPVFPAALPGAAVSPGTSNCNLASAPGFTVIAGLVFAVLDASDTSDDVRVQVPTVFNVTLSVWVPPLSAALAGSTAFVSVLVIRTVSPELTAFQFASTAL